jgi:hypothetical protein
MVADTLALLEFTFGLTASRFDVRRGQCMEEADAIGTTFLREGPLHKPHRTEVRAMILRASVRRHRSAGRPADAPVDPTESRSKRLQRVAHGRFRQLNSEIAIDPTIISILDEAAALLARSSLGDAGMEHRLFACNSPSKGNGWGPAVTSPSAELNEPRLIS